MTMPWKQKNFWLVQVLKILIYENDLELLLSYEIHKDVIKLTIRKKEDTQS